MIKVLIVDDHELLREGLKQAINETEEFEVMDEAGDGCEAMTLVRKNHYDIVVLDISMPGKNGLEVLEELKIENADLRVLILSMYAEEQYAVQAIKIGASGYLTKGSAKRELISALKRIISNKVYISENVSEQLVHRVQDPSDAPLHEMLSPREFQIFLMIAEGNSAKEISEVLALSTSAISTHRKRALEKLNLKNNADIVRYAFRNGFID